MEGTLTKTILSKKWLLIVIIMLLAIIVGSFTVATFFDLEISKALYGMDSGFGKFFAYFFEVVGFLPALLINVFLFILLFNHFKKIWIRIIFAVLTFSTLMACGFVAFNPLVENEIMQQNFLLIPGAIIAIVVGIPALIYSKRINVETRNKLIYITIIAAIVGTLTCGTVAIVQFSWGRARFFSLDDTFAGYTPWYIKDLGSSALKLRSFPSLHSASSFSTVSLILLAWVLNTKKLCKISLIVTAITILVCVPLSRVVKGYHYATDVLASTIIGIIFLFAAIPFVDWLYNRKRNKTAQTQDQDQSIAS